MVQFLPRGHELSSNNRIKKKVSEGSNWQIYITNNNVYVLAVLPEVYRFWVTELSVPEDIFNLDETRTYYVYSSEKNGMISSVQNGPFPDTLEQIESFSIAFRNITARNPNVNLGEAIFLEELRLLLPLPNHAGYIDKGYAFGKWITGGVNVSVYSNTRINEIMTWLPNGALDYFIAKAGLDNSKVKNEVEQKKESERNLDAPVLNGDGFSLVGRPELESFFRENIIDIVLNQEEYRRMGIEFPGATILYGPPGCGKTYAVERLAEFLGWPRFNIDSSTIASTFIHDTSKKISEVFRAAIESAPSVLIIDEMEAFLSNRGNAGPSGVHHMEEVAEFLRQIPEAVSKGVLIFAMTNMLDSIDPAILRRGRFDYIVEVKMASADEIYALLKEKSQNIPMDETVDLQYISKQLDNHPMSDVTFVLKEAGKYAVKNKLKHINMECFKNAINVLPIEEKKNRIGF